jgi:predicted dehydrogenase
MDRIRVGVIGVGIIGKHHIGEYSKNDGAEILAIADLNEAEARRVAEANGVPHVYADFRELLKRDDLQAVDVCLHNNFHAPVTLAALHAGKDVFCEKPMAGAYVDANEMLDTARKLGRKLSIQIGTLFSRETKVAKRLIDEGHLGKLYHARSTGHRRRGRPFVDGYATPSFVKKETAAGGALYDMGVYHISRLLYLLGNPKVERVTGKTYQEVAMDPGRKESSGFDVEELGVGFVRMEGGISLDVIEAWAIHMNAFEGSFIVGSEGGIRLDPFSLHRPYADLEMDATFDLNGYDTRRRRLNPDESAYDSPISHWVAALQGRVPLLPTAEIALQTMLISEGIYLSERLGREVSAEEVLSLSQSSAVSL